MEATIMGYIGVIIGALGPRFKVQGLGFRD